MEPIWNISSHEEFERVALATFRRQAALCAPYGRYLNLLGCDVAQVQSVAQIPFLPIELFKSCDVYCGATPPEAIFTSSGDVASHHAMSSLAHYETTFVAAFEQFYGSLSQWSIYALLPSYLEREGSSLIYMVDGMVRRSGAGGGFYLYDHAQLLADLRRDLRPKILLGVSYALLDLAESGLVREPLRDTIVMETGGMKGRRAEMVKSQLHTTLERAFGVESIHSEYGMAELTSQGYSSGLNRFSSPRWMSVAVRDLADPLAVTLSYQVAEQGLASLRGGLNIVDLASQDSCAFVQTQDLGELFADGSFTVEGRVARSDVRGCNLLVQ
ncbi:MAG: acyltransferase [Rikenellaceae bacterium]